MRAAPRRQCFRLDLNGVWQLRFNDGQRGGAVNRLLPADADLRRALAARVPGEVHLDLLRAGLIQEPATGLNILSARWVEETLWYYRRAFRLPALARGAVAQLVFEGLDLAAVIHLNGKEVGRHSNAFYPCRLDVTAALRPGENVLVVELDAGLFHAGERSATGLGVGFDARLHKRPWLRKSQCSFGWDWSPRLLNVGITGNVGLEIHSGIRLDGFTALAELQPDLKTGVVTGRVFVEGLDRRTRHGELRLRIDELDLDARQAVAIKPGLQSFDIRLAVPQPCLWWPIGHGPQPLYTVRAAVSADGREFDAGCRQVGFRRVRIAQEPHPAGGRRFALEINGKPIFAKGGNFVPADLIFQRIDRARYARLIELALEANFNLLRVWGGGLYESDAFYELCDRRGILVWQEFIFACAKYPTTDEAFLADIKREATWQIRRLAHHPSLIVWCGNNELEWGNYSWGYDKGVAYPDYALFHMVLPRVLKKEDGTRFYQPSSPFSPELEDPTRDDMGDQHPWTVGFRDDDLRAYRAMTCRFPDEGGTLGSTALPTVRACLQGGPERVGTFAWEMHENSVAYWHAPNPSDQTILHTTGRDPASMSLADWAYFAGVVQSEGLHEYIRNFRRRMFDSAAAVFWMYNDCWPAVRSWSIVDYYARRTPAFHPVRRSFQSCALALAQDGADIKVFGVNEGPEIRAQLRYGIFALAGGLPFERRANAVLPANSATVLAAFPARRWRALGVRTHGAFAILSRNGTEVARDRLFLPRVNEMRLPRARVTVRWADGKAVFRSRAFAWNVCLDLDGEKKLPDNFFDVLPGIPTVLDWPARLGKPRIIRIANP